jgi:quinol monooxygenase YgiN
MFYINVWLTVKDPADVLVVRDALSRAAALSRTEPGCERFDVFHSQNDPLKFLLVECWSSRAAWEDHRTRAAVKTIYEPEVLPRVNREPHFSTRVE